MRGRPSTRCPTSGLKAPKVKVAGTIYILQDLFPDQPRRRAVWREGSRSRSSSPPVRATARVPPRRQLRHREVGETIGTLPEEPVIRAIVTNILTNDTSTELLGSAADGKPDPHGDPQTDRCKGQPGAVPGSDRGIGGTRCPRISTTSRSSRRSPLTPPAWGRAPTSVACVTCPSIWRSRSGAPGCPVGEASRCVPGSIIKLDRLAEEPLDLLVNGTRIARGEVVVDRRGLRPADHRGGRSRGRPSRDLRGGHSVTRRR